MTITMSTTTPAPPDRRRRLPSGGWVPVALLAVAAVAVLRHFGVPDQEIGAFAGYIGIGVMVPGVLLWRALGPGGGSLPADLAAGLALGYAIEVLVYIPARAAGVPLAVLAWPVLTIVTFLLVPRLRRHWRGDGGRVPLWWAWAMSGIVGYLVAWSARQFFPVHGLTWPGYAAPYVDMPYHLALLGELKHHVPPTFPAVLGERLSYHWFVYAEMAATSWVTGIEPQTLLYRLSALPMLAATAVLVPAIAWRVTGRPWAGVAAILVTCFTCAPEAYRGDADLFSTGSIFGAWLSPTQNFGAALFAPVVLSLVAFLRSGRGRWGAVSILLLALTGAKATFLPLVLGGLGLVLAVRLLVDRRPHRAASTGVVIAAVCLLIAQFVIFGRGSQGMAIEPLDSIRWVWRTATGVTEAQAAALGAGPLLALTGLYLACVCCAWAGLAGLSRRAELLDPAVLLLIGIGAAGIAAVLVLGHPAVSQFYFLAGARPYLSIAAVAGIAALFRRQRAAWPVAVGAAALGAWLITMVAGRLGPVVPLRPRSALPVLQCYLLLGLVCLILWLLLALWRRPAALVVVALATGYTLPAMIDRVVGPLGPPGSYRPTIPRGALEAGRWLREHSGPDDVVATDGHCRPVRSPYCDSRHYWVSAYSERRVLVEGWAYAESTLSRAPLAEVSYLSLDFADPARLVANDAAFLSPSAENIGRLAQKYRVKWLFVDESRKEISPELGRFARLRFRSGACSIYQIISG